MDVAWAAGFIEGEGHMARQSAATVMPKITAAQVQREPLERLQKIFGGSIYFSRSPPAHPNHSDKWIWYASGRTAVEICMTLYVLMSPKRQRQIEAALAAWRATPVRRENLSKRCRKGHIIDGNNARVTAYYKGKPYVSCRECEGEANRARHDRERAGRLLIPRIAKLIPRRAGQQIACGVCGHLFIARNSRHSYCSMACGQKARVALLAELRAAVRLPKRIPYARA